MGVRGAPLGHTALKSPQERLMVPITLSWDDRQFSTMAFIDSGVGGVFLDATLGTNLLIPTLPKTRPACVTTLVAIL